jgi:hypothetical protein
MLMITLNKSNTALVRLTFLVLNDRDVVITLTHFLHSRRVKTWSVKNLNLAAFRTERFCITRQAAKLRFLTDLFKNNPFGHYAFYA